MGNPVALGMGGKIISEAGLFHVLAWCMEKNMGLKTISHTKPHGARTLPVSTNHSQGPNSWPREKCTKRLMSALFLPH